MDGIELVIDINAQDFPNSYKYKQESILARTVFKNGTWRVTSISRGRTQGYGKEIHCVLTDKARGRMFAKYYLFIGR